MKKDTQGNINRVLMWVIFIISPLTSFIISLKNYRQRALRIFVYAFALFYGYTYIPIPNSDGASYMDDFLNTESYNFKTYTNEIAQIAVEKPGVVEVYAQTLKFVAFNVSKNVHVYFMLAAAVYFFVFFKLLDSLWLIVKEKASRNYLSFFLGVMFVYNLSAGVNGIRFPLAFMVFCYGAINLVTRKKIKYLLIACSSVFIHFAITFSVAFLLVSYFVKFKSNRYLLYILLISAYISSYLFTAFLEQNLNFLGDSAQSKYTGYTGEGYVETREELVENWNWYIRFNLYSTYYFCLISLLALRLPLFKIRFDKTANRLFFFAMIMLLHSILSGSVLEIVSNRYNNVFMLSTLAYIFYTSAINYRSRVFKFMNYVYIPILILNILIKFRGDLYTVSPMLLYGNPILAMFGEYSTSIQDMLLGTK